MNDNEELITRIAERVAYSAKTLFYVRAVDGRNHDWQTPQKEYLAWLKSAIKEEIEETA